MNKNKGSQIAVIIVSVVVLIGCTYFLLQFLGIGSGNKQSSEEKTEEIPAPFDDSLFYNQPDDPRIQTLNKLNTFKDYVVPTPTDLKKDNPFLEEIAPKQE